MDPAEPDEIVIELVDGDKITFDEKGDPIDTLTLVTATNNTDPKAEVLLEADVESIDPSKEGKTNVVYIATSNDTEAEFKVTFEVTKDSAAVEESKTSSTKEVATTTSKTTTTTSGRTTTSSSNGSYQVTTSSSSSRPAVANKPSTTSPGSGNTSSGSEQKTVEELTKDLPEGGQPGNGNLHQGAGAPGYDDNTSPCTPTTTVVHHDAVTHVVHHDAVTQQVYVVDVPAHYGNMVICLTCNQQFANGHEWDLHSIETEHGNFTVKNVLITEEQGHYENQVVSAAWDETVVDSEAWDETVSVPCN